MLRGRIFCAVIVIVSEARCISCVTTGIHRKLRCNQGRSATAGRRLRRLGRVVIARSRHESQCAKSGQLGGRRRNGAARTYIANESYQSNTMHSGAGIGNTLLDRSRRQVEPIGARPWSLSVLLRVAAVLLGDARAGGCRCHQGRFGSGVPSVRPRILLCNDGRVEYRTGRARADTRIRHFTECHIYHLHSMSISALFQGV
mmetsp:Transcript_30383/g.61632  ORF Transcript_30383/g.61632 Transcript_30383/m.61632 type:complete len:201 (-) Transcript_30383:414-1016(-)